ncbi:glutamate N-acetyltransferase [Lachnospiraceae bacterium RM5]|nr:glutamate N-acetyltransferase [Lachnospiraceae bacterium RM5]
MNHVEGGVCAPLGFKAGSTWVGIKASNKEKDDLAMIFCEEPCVCAGTFTTNVVKAAPVKWDRKVIDESDDVRAIVINSGIANAATGERGMKNCAEIAKGLSAVSGLREDEILCASTGVIGPTLPVAKILEGIEKIYPALDRSAEKANNAAVAIMTTDTHPKEVSVKVNISGKDVTIGGMCKGSGMIHINMSTMLSFITTDADISKEMLTKALTNVVKDTYNMVSVDGDTSTNDTVIIMANKMANNEKITTENEDYNKFYEALYVVCSELAKNIAKDGEGATTLIETRVLNAASKDMARKLAKSVISSSLTKAAIFGKDANCGRILCALGYAGVDFDIEKVNVYYESKNGRIMMVEKGVVLEFDEDYAYKVLDSDEVAIICDMNAGKEDAIAWGCDLTYEYVKINADYRS